MYKKQSGHLYALFVYFAPPSTDFKPGLLGASLADPPRAGMPVFARRVGWPGPVRRRRRRSAAAAAAPGAALRGGGLASRGALRGLPPQGGSWPPPSPGAVGSLQWGSPGGARACAEAPGRARRLALLLLSSGERGPCPGAGLGPPAK